MREQVERAIAIDHLAARVDEERAVRVAVERDPESASVRDRLGAQRLEVQRAAALVDVASVGGDPIGCTWAPRR